MMGKLGAWDHDRPAAIGRLRAAMAAVEVVGLATNRDLLAAVAAHPVFAAAELDTGFIDRYREELVLAVAPARPAALAVAALDELLRRTEAAARREIGRAHV